MPSPKAKKAGSAGQHGGTWTKVLLLIGLALAVAVPLVVLRDACGGASADRSSRGLPKNDRGIRAHAPRLRRARKGAATDAALVDAGGHDTIADYKGLLQCVLHDRTVTVEQAGQMQQAECKAFRDPEAWKMLKASKLVDLHMQDCTQPQDGSSSWVQRNASLNSLQQRSISLRPDSSDFLVFIQVFCSEIKHRTWDFLFDVLPLVPLDRPVQVLDAGANIGLASMLLASFIGYNGVVTAVEANPPTFDLMQRNLQNQSEFAPVLAALVAQPQALQGEKVMMGTGEGESWFAARIQASAPPASPRSKEHEITDAKRQHSSQLASSAGSQRDPAPMRWWWHWLQGDRAADSSAESHNEASAAAAISSQTIKSNPAKLLREGARAMQQEVPTTSLTQLVAQTSLGRYDFIKLDIEGYELHILRDPASRDVLCKAICIFAELHDKLHIPGLEGIKDAWDDFLLNGCDAGYSFVHVRSQGEHVAVCREDMLQAAGYDIS